VVIVTSWLFSLVFERPFLTHRSFSALWRLVSRRRSVLPESA